MTKETIDVSMTQQVERERNEGKKRTTKTWRCTSSTCLFFHPIFSFSFFSSLALFKSNREDQEGTKAVFAHTFWGCYVYSNWLPFLLILLSPVSNIINHWLFLFPFSFSSSSSSSKISFFLSLSLPHSSNRFVGRQTFFLIGYLGFISIKRKTYI